MKHEVIKNLKVVFGLTIPVWWRRKIGVYVYTGDTGPNNAERAIVIEDQIKLVSHMVKCLSINDCRKLALK